MKLNGIVPKVEREVVIPILSDTVSLYFIAKPIASYDPFEALCPMPKARIGGEPGKERPMVETSDYKEAMRKHGQLFAEWVNVTTLAEVAGSDGKREAIDWETVDLEQIETYPNWRVELKENNGLSESDIRRIELEVLRCNSMDEALIEKAKEDFLAIAKRSATMT